MLTAGSTSVRRRFLLGLAGRLRPAVRSVSSPVPTSPPPPPTTRRPRPSSRRSTRSRPSTNSPRTPPTSASPRSPRRSFATPAPLAPDGRQTNYQSIDELQNSFDYAHRFLLSGPVYLKLGVSYERYDFGTTDAPIPSTLQDLNGLVALEYVVHGHTGAFIRASPGVYYSQASHISLGSVDVPVAIGSAFKVPYFKNVYGLAGVNISILAHDVVDPILGRHLDRQRQPAPHGRAAHAPAHLQPHRPSGRFRRRRGQSGQAYKRAENDSYRPQFKRFSGGVIDFTEDRVGGGLTLKPHKGIEIDASGGWDLGRTFNYYRGRRRQALPHRRRALREARGQRGVLRRVLFYIPRVRQTYSASRMGARYWLLRRPSQSSLFLPHQKNRFFSRCHSLPVGDRLPSARNRRQSRRCQRRHQDGDLHQPRQLEAGTPGARPRCNLPPSPRPGDRRQDGAEKP